MDIVALLPCQGAWCTESDSLVMEAGVPCSYFTAPLPDPVKAERLVTAEHFSPL